MLLGKRRRDKDILPLRLTISTTGQRQPRAWKIVWANNHDEMSLTVEDETRNDVGDLTGTW